MTFRDFQGHSVVDEVLYHDMYHLMPLYQDYVMSLIKANDVTTLKNLVYDGFEYVMKGGGTSALEVAQQAEASDVVEFIPKVPEIMVSTHVTRDANVREGCQKR